MCRMRDLLNDWLIEKILGRFECDARPSRMVAADMVGVKDIEAVFRRRWRRAAWSVWWWANGEEKARAKMERWREGG